MRLLVSMGNPVRHYDPNSYGGRYDRAIIQIIDFDSRTVEQEIEYKPEDPKRWPNVGLMFKGAYLYEDECWVVTNNEVVVYDRNNWTLKKVSTHPTFNDLHGVLPTAEGYFVCNTGLDIVQQFDHSDKLVKTINVATTPTEDRFDLSDDYRNVASTKPHEVHPNQLFFHDGELWVTRCRLKSAAKVDDSSVSTAEFPAVCHDGLVIGNRIYFTTVRGHIMAVNKETLEIDLELDVNEVNDLNLTVGWTRGLAVDGQNAYLGNTALRESKSIEFAKWIKKKAGGRIRMGSAIVKVDLESQRVVDVFQFKKRAGAAIYSIIPLQD